ncbi:hypothetical protein [Mucilaginibacter sp.]|uniref:hypothetical protein n=1 Tax=Mucilaginibacter sp. TaxID=1882438 RepID=UPI003267EE33
MTFDGGVHRTTKMNEAAEVIYLKNKELRARKMGQKSSKMTSPHKGWIQVQNPHRFVDELIEIGSLSKKTTN